MYLGHPPIPDVVTKQVSLKICNRNMAITYLKFKITAILLFNTTRWLITLNESKSNTFSLHRITLQLFSLSISSAYDLNNNVGLTRPQISMSQAKCFLFYFWLLSTYIWTDRKQISVCYNYKTFKHCLKPRSYTLIYIKGFTITTLHSHFYY